MIEKYVLVRKFGSNGAYDGKLVDPSAIAVDSLGNVYVADRATVLKYDNNGKFITAWGSPGTSNGQFHDPYPEGIALDSRQANVYVTDTGNNRIQKFDSNGKFITEWGSKGSNNTQFNDPSGIAVDSLGNVYVADSANNRVQKFDSNGKFITEWRYDSIVGIAVDSGSIYVTDWDRPIQKFDNNGKFITDFDTSHISRHILKGIAVDSIGNVYVSAASPDSDMYDSMVQKFDSNGKFITKWGSTGTGDGQFMNLESIAIDSIGNVYTIDHQKDNRVQKFDSNGKFITKWGSTGTGDGQFMYTTGISLDKSDNVYVVDQRNDRIEIFAQSPTKRDT
jgi:DNA-binding beta-propeller fold protein YncE